MKPSIIRTTNFDLGPPPYKPVSGDIPPSKTFPYLTLVLSFVVTVLGVSTGLLAYENKLLRDKLSTPTNYKACMEAQGSLVQESYPATCVTVSGARFTEPLGDTEKKKLLPPQDISNWKTYSNENCGLTNPKSPFNISFPADWEETKLQTTVPKQQNEYRYADKNSWVLITCGTGFGGGCDNWSTIKVGSDTKDICYDTTIGKFSNIIIKDPQNNNGFSISGNITDKLLLDQILSTFKFL